MAAADPPAGLMDIASTIAPDDIPFKLRCAICSKLAVNAFRLPCCDQSICETCQASLTDTCPVCAHNPVSPDLCKPNKALRTTLKAFLRTEEKKREKDRQATAPPTPTTAAPAPAENDSAPVEALTDQNLADVTPMQTSELTPMPETKPSEAAAEVEGNNAELGAPEPAEPEAKPEPPSEQATESADANETDAPPADGNTVTENELAPQDVSQPDSSMTNMGPGGFPQMSWNAPNNFNAMNPFMGNPMFNFPNPMGMPMTMGPMAANQGMFGDYGMNMTGMGMNMGMNYNGQGMYGSIGWDGSQQNMWQGGPNKFNPNAFVNGTGPPHGGAFGGSNMSYPPNPDFQSGYHAPGYGRGGFRGRGRGHFQGPGRGSFHGANPGFPNQSTPSANGTPAGTENSSHDVDNEEPASGADATDGNTEPTAAEQDATGTPGQLQGIPTVDSLDQSMPTGPNAYQGGPGYGRGGYVRGSGAGNRGGFWGGPMPGYQPNMEPRGPGVEGAPAAPRAMRQGLPNTSVLRQQGFHSRGRSSISSNTPAQGTSSETPHDPSHPQSPSKAPSQAKNGDSRSQSASRSGSRPRSPSTRVADEDRGSRRDRETRRTTHTSNGRNNDRHSPSPSVVSSRRSSRRRHQDSDRDRRDGHRSHRSHRRRSRSRSRSRTRNGDTRHPDRHGLIADGKKPLGFLPSAIKPSSEAGDSRDIASRINGSRRSSKDRSSRRDEDRARDRDSRRRDRDRRDRDRDSERDRRRDRERDRDREWDRGRDRELDRKRSRRDRSGSPTASEVRDRRVKRAREDRTRDRESPRPSATEPAKDPHTLEREARNRERLLREQQRREQAKSGRRDSRQERIVAGRRINYKYEDEL